MFQALTCSIMFDTLAQLQVVVNCLVLLNLSEVGIGQAFMIAWATPTCPTGRTSQ